MRPPLPGTPTGGAAAPPRASATLDAESAAAFTRIGVAVYDTREGRLALAHQPDAPFTSASLVKLLIAFDALEHGEQPGRVHQMLSRSDDGIASALWLRYGGPEIVTRWSRRIGLEATSPPSDPGRWGDTILTARDVVRIYRYLLEESPADTRAVVLGSLRNATRHGADGFDQYFGIPRAARGRPFAVKQGWSCCGVRTLHTTGLLGPSERFVIVVLTESPVQVTWEEAGARVTSTVSRILTALRD